MLDRLYVKNLALIKEVEIELGAGLNILTGETGAGKSIIIGSVNLCLGGKADKDMIRDGAEYALIELVFRPDESVLKAVKEMDMPVEEDGSIIISRKISSSKSQIRVCGESVTVRQVKELAALLLDVHGQHEHQSLLKAGRQRELLDAYGGSEMRGLLEKMKEAYEEYESVLKKLAELDMDSATRAREISLAEYEIKQIEDAAITPGEEKELEERYKRMKRSLNNHEALNRVAELLNGNEGISDRLGRCIYDMNSMNEDGRLKEIGEKLINAEGYLSDAYRELRRYIEEEDFDPEEFAQIESRLDTIRSLILKYGRDEEEVLKYLEKRRERLSELTGMDETLAKLRVKQEKAAAGLDKAAESITKLRKKTAVKLEKEISEALLDLNFLKVNFNIELKEKEECSPYGREDIVFTISLNPGEEARPLSEVASGGELSRIMLALKSVFAKKDEIGTLVFDEIDTGISGKTAWKVSEKMGALARSHQLICITHLPQIAAMADSHFLIEKNEKEGRTISDIRLLTEQEKAGELARMLGGDSISEASLLNAEELIKQAEAVKAQDKKTL